MSKKPSLRRQLYTAFSLLLDINRFLEQQREKYGDTFYAEIPGVQPALVTACPDKVKQIFQASPEILTSVLPNPMETILGPQSLLLMQDEDHTYERKALMPFFQGQALRDCATMMSAVAQQSVAQWQGSIGATEATRDITLNIIVQVIFGVSDQQRQRLYKDRINDLMQAFSPVFMLLPFLQHNFAGLGPWAKFSRVKEAFDATIYEDIDAISRMSDEADQHPTIIKNLIDINSHAGQVNKARIRDELVTLLLAGNETTANSLNWALFYLAKDHAVQQRLQEELDASADQTMESLNKLSWLDAVCREVLRIHPVVPIVLRSVRQDFSLDEYQLKRDDIVCIATHLVHSHPSVWTDPHVFVPERFLQKKYSASEFMPFSGGQKKCLGFGFAFYEMKIVLAEILGNFSLRLADKKAVKPSLHGITMGPNRSVRILLDKRSR